MHAPGIRCGKACKPIQQQGGRAACVAPDAKKGTLISDGCMLLTPHGCELATIACQTVGCDLRCRVYGPRVAALGKKGKAAHSSTCLAAAKDLICQGILSKRTLPPSSEPTRCAHPGAVP